MFITMIRACCVVAVTLCFLGGCHKTERAESSRESTNRPATGQGEVQTGEILFRQFCSNCHPDGGNVSDPKRTLRGASLRENRITTTEDIVKIMRHPLSRMIRFDAETIPDREARSIAEYILTAFR